ncbi:dihydrolipoyllysine-residue acetyltransferase component 2 of pyruvate dehydrogenase complex, mitochondrial-like isoform X4 [Triticum urartu]|uniref:dihydrolipoyllysine-residue acetyltransferase component 2 of pyruvate dehydrogenase complex, mitochondrial isoform X4 n=1 Tax=Triticum aestivum TaxID=4565 RepID=UPI001D033704|nr:dihydrolipoyllysine-residue acetyltransferase component 2 of pyruvate dehydrogenase complex, mitochondrial-like isoform X4 [Triticum aestivum]XP_048544018.1 dihydrolipoyllysine-residue acetyltransferase component 2 of pyruvate dehydrogenase complex, mitochondrial-like isoform X4 [Triticum urartu]
MALLLRHSRKLRRVHGVLDCERGSIARHFSVAAAKEDAVSSSSVHGEYGKKVGRSSIFLDRQSEKDLHAFKVSSREARGSYSSKRMPIAATGVNSLFSCGQVVSARHFSSGADLPPHEAIGMPSLSPTMTEGNIAKWVKKEGDKVSPGEVLCEVETDKATVEMECMEEGYLAKIVCGDGAKEIKVGEIIAITVEEEGDIEKFKDYKASSSAAAPAESKPQSEPVEPKEEKKEVSKAPEPTATKTEESSQSGDRLFSSPVARKLAEDNNVPLSSLKAKGSKKEAAAAPGLGYVDLPNTQIRKVTANRLLQSKQTIPHYYLTVDSRVDKLIKLRSELNPMQDASGGKKISINDLVIKAAALALRKVPACNSSWMNDFIRQYHNVNINVAVQTEHGLFVPVVRDADKKGLAAIADEVKQLASRAKDNSLKPEDYEGGTFTVSNLGGPFGIKQFCAIVNPPQSAILAIGSAEKRVIPGAAEGQYEIGSFMSATLSCDHRVIDGAMGAEWLKAFKGYLEDPTTMLL